jgi:hypothetical protein
MVGRRHFGATFARPVLLLLLLDSCSYVSCSGPLSPHPLPEPLASPLTSLDSYPLNDPLRSLALTQALLSLDLGAHVLNSQLLRESIGLGISPRSGNHVLRKFIQKCNIHITYMYVLYRSAFYFPIFQQGSRRKWYNVCTYMCVGKYVSDAPFGFLLKNCKIKRSRGTTNEAESGIICENEK